MLSQQHILKFETQKDEPDLTLARSYTSLSNFKLERQGFATETRSNTWNYKLDTET